MTSERKIISNRSNAQKSTGPRSALGRLRSRRNAPRHGLAVAIRSDPLVSKDIAALATTLACGRSGRFAQEFACEIAEAHLDLVQIRKVRNERLVVVAGNPDARLEDYSVIDARLVQLERYGARFHGASVLCSQ